MLIWTRLARSLVAAGLADANMDQAGQKFSCSRLVDANMDQAGQKLVAAG